MDRDAQAVIATMAARIRTVYIEERRKTERMRTGYESHYNPGPHWDGGEVRLKSGQIKKRQPTWPKVAEFMLHKGIDPETYIRQTFRLATAGGKVPMPNHLTSDWLFQLFKEWWPHYSQEIKTAFEHQKEYARGMLASYADATEFTPTQRWGWLLLDERAPMTALFRYCLAVSENLSTIARRYHEGAVQDYLRSPKEFDKHWGNWIPERLKQEALRIRQYALAGDKE